MTNVFLGRGVRIEIHESQIARFTLPGGDVYKEMNRLSTAIKEAAVVLTRAGANKSRAYVERLSLASFTEQYGGEGTSFQVNVTDVRLHEAYRSPRPIGGPDGVTFRVSNTRPYAAYVFLGHSGGFRSGHGWPVGASQLGYRGALLKIAQKDPRVKWANQVKGYSGRNYPMEAARAVMRLRGY